MRGERDFEAYVAARGATVVRGLLLLGLDLPEAEDTAAAAFASLRSDWHELQQSADPDVVLWATVLAVEHEDGVGARRPAPLDEAASPGCSAGPRRLEELQACDVLGVSVPRLRALLAGQRRRAASDDEVDGSRRAGGALRTGARGRAPATGGGRGC